MTEYLRLGDTVKYDHKTGQVWGVSHDEPMRYDVKIGREFHNSIPATKLERVNENHA